MGLHEKRFNPEGKLVVAKADGMRFGGKSYAQGEAITDPLLTMRKARQLYFQNKLCYDYEISDKVADREEAARARALAEARFAEETARRAEQERADAALAAHAAAQAEAQQKADLARAIEQANRAAGRAPHAAAPALTEVHVEATTGYIAPVEPVVEIITAPAVETVEVTASPAAEFAPIEGVIEQPAVAPAPRRRRASSVAGDTSEAPATEAPQE